MDCIFCQMINGTLPVSFIYEDDDIVAFHDIKPVAPLHQLIIPKRHIESVNSLTLEDSILTGRMVWVAQQLAREAKLAEQGFRLVFNCNSAGGQEVRHLHLHLLAGRQMHWPPG